MKDMKEIFYNLKKHPLSMIKNQYIKLEKNKNDFEFSIICLDKMISMGMNHGDRDQFINRLWIDKLDKTKNWKIISELLSITSSQYYLDYGL